MLWFNSFIVLGVLYQICPVQYHCLGDCVFATCILTSVNHGGT